MSTAETVSPDCEVVLHDIPWATYVTLRDMPENENIRMTYDRGELEITSPSPLHEGIAALLGTLIDVWTIELNVGIKSCRMMTIRRVELKARLRAGQLLLRPERAPGVGQDRTGFQGRSAARSGDRGRDQPQRRA